MTSDFSDKLASTQWDYANDPATADVRKESDDFFKGYFALRDRVAKYKVRATPTATDLKNQEEKLDELQPQLDAMEKEFYRRRGDYHGADGAGMPVPPSTDGKGALDKNRWDEGANRKLLSERASGATHARLASQYGISRQAVTKQIKKAEDSLLSRKTASPFDAILRSRPKK